MSTLNPACARFNEQLKHAMTAVHHLSDHQAAPRSITLGGRKPVIVIDPPTDAAFIRGAMFRRERVGQVVRQVMAAPFHGCQLEWEGTERPAAQAHHG